MEGRFDSTHVKNACLAINTADYCQTTAMEVSFPLDCDTRLALP